MPAEPSATSPAGVLSRPQVSALRPSIPGGGQESRGLAAEGGDTGTGSMCQMSRL